MNGQCRRIARGADLHCLCRGHAARHWHDGVRFHPRIFCVTAIDRFAKPATVNEHFVAGVEALVFGTYDGSCEIDAADERVSSQYLAGAGRR